MGKYPQIVEGQPVDIDWRHKDYKIACCDCGLVHRFRFASVGNTLRIRAWRDNRATSAIRRVKKHTQKEILEFILKFNTFEKDDVLKNTFTQGYCYYFSVILRERFPGGKIVYSPMMGHFLYKLNGSLYDINGVSNTSTAYYDFDNYPDYLQKDRIIRDCVLKV